MTNSIEGGRYSQDEIRNVLASNAIKKGPLSFEKAVGILDLAASIIERPLLTSEFAQHANQVMSRLADEQLVQHLVTWNSHQETRPVEWASFMRNLKGSQRSQMTTTLQAVRKSQEGVDLRMVREESALGELTQRLGISVVRQAFLYIATKKIES